jgi:myo-inositol-1(or 4)-monophosphatase
MTILEADKRIYEKALHVGGIAAREAGSYILEHAGSVREKDVTDKGKNDLVTQVDLEAQNRIIQRIKGEFPKHWYVAEEGGGNRPEFLERDGFVWIIDPIDGTTNFTRGVPPYAVSIALQHDGELVMGIVLDVTRNEIFTAAIGLGAHVNGEPLRVSRTDHLNESLVTTGFPYRVFDHVDEYLTSLKHFMRESRGVRRPGSASVDLAYVASGRFDGFFETGLEIWDVAAGIVLVREAGGRITDYFDGDGYALGGQIVASNGRVHDHMLHLLQPVKNVLDEPA